MGPDPKRLKLSHPELGVLLVSGYTDLLSLTSDVPRISKPFVLDDLAAALQQLA